MYVTHRFKLNQYTIDLLRDMEPEFGYDGFGEFLFYRTYSRWIKDEQRQENWADCVIRVITGTMTIRKDWYIKNHISWNEKFWQTMAKRMAVAMFKMHWLPPGRGLWAMGTQFIYERGSMALYNCSATNIGKKFEYDFGWSMDSLMLGVGVGFSPQRDDDLVFKYPSSEEYDFVIPDTREGWVDSIVRQMHALKHGLPQPRMIYDEIRLAGELIAGFGGIASGPEPLKYLHEKIEELFQWYMDDPYYDSVMLKTDLENLIGCCVVAGNVRRSAELGSQSINDPIFVSMKDYENPRFAYRAEWGWMSNNSVDLIEDSDFEKLDEVAKRVIERGEPGYKNLQNFPLGRIGKKDNIRKDKAKYVNPCIPGWAPVLTPKGIRKLNDIKEGDMIWGPYGWTKVNKKWSNGIKKVFKYNTTAGVFYGTENHRILWDGWKVPVGEAIGIDCLEGPYFDSLINYNFQAIVDGLVVGDGEDKEGTILLCIGQKDQDYWSSSIRPFIGVRYNKEYQYKINTTINKLENTYNRTIPDHYFYGERENICSFLRGLYSANGSICGSRITLKATSFELIQQVQMMLSSIGIRSYFTTNKTNVVQFINGTYVCRESYDLNISTDREKFARIIGFIQFYKETNMRIMINAIGTSPGAKGTYDIVKTELISEEEVFDINVDNGSHTFWSGGCHVSNCGEIPLEHREVCNIDETFPTRCKDHEEWLKACGYASLYCSTVSLLPTHQPSTNRVVSRNRRIGVGIVDYTGWKHSLGVNQTTKWLREGYKEVRKTNRWANGEAGVPEAIRVTTVKPGGTIPKVAGKTSGAGHPTFDYTLRRVVVAKNHPVAQLLIDANVPYEDSVTDAYSYVFEWPILQGPARPAKEVSLWEQAMNLVLLQREWSDNAVSNTLYFRPKWVLSRIINQQSLFLGAKPGDNKVQLIQDKQKRDIEYELKSYIAQQIDDDDLFYKISAAINDGSTDIIEGDWKIKCSYNQETDDFVEAKVYKFDPNHEEDAIEPVLSAIAPLTKTVSLLPHTAEGVYAQMPESHISKEEYVARKAMIQKIDWSQLKNSEGQDERYCQGAQCELPIKGI